MSTSDLVQQAAEALRLAAHATPGPWAANVDCVLTQATRWQIADTRCAQFVEHEDCPIISDEEVQYNAEFIAACRTFVPEAAKAVMEMTSKLDIMQTALEKIARLEETDERGTARLMEGGCQKVAVTALETCNVLPARNGHDTGTIS
jgi:hypothetical protein